MGELAQPPQEQEPQNLDAGAKEARQRLFDTINNPDLTLELLHTAVDGYQARCQELASVLSDERDCWYGFQVLLGYLKIIKATGLEGLGADFSWDDMVQDAASDFETALDNAQSETVRGEWMKKYDELFGKADES